MKVMIPSQLRSYTIVSEVQAQGNTLAEVLADLDSRYPGFRFRIVSEQETLRPHILVFVNQEIARELDHAIREEDVVRIVGALSGG